MCETENALGIDMQELNEHLNAGEDWLEQKQRLHFFRSYKIAQPFASVRQPVEKLDGSATRAVFCKKTDRRRAVRKP
jgi:hypothetical protein